MTLAISSTPAAPIASMRAPSTKPPVSDESAAKAAKQLAASKKVAEDFRVARRDVRDMAKARARETVQRLRDELKLLTKLLAGNPEAFARQVARIAKELRAAFKDFAAAHKGDVQDATLAREAAATEAAEQAASAKAADAEKPADGEAVDAAASQAPAEQKLSGYVVAVEPRTLEERRRAAGIEDTPEAREMKDFIAELRGTLKKLRELLEEAKIKAGAAAKKQPGEDDPFGDAEKELKELQKDLDRAFQDVSAEAKMPIERGAFVSVQA